MNTQGQRPYATPVAAANGRSIDPAQPALPLGQGRLLREGQRGAILNFGPLLTQAQEVAEALDLTLADMRFVKPLDSALIDRLADSHQLLVTLEDHAVLGGAGSAVADYLSQRRQPVALLPLGVPDRWIEHDSRSGQLSSCGLDAQGIRRAIESRLNP